MKRLGRVCILAASDLCGREGGWKEGREGGREGGGRVRGRV